MPIPVSCPLSQHVATNLMDRYLKVRQHPRHPRLHTGPGAYIILQNPSPAPPSLTHEIIPSVADLLPPYQHPLFPCLRSPPSPRPAATGFEWDGASICAQRCRQCVARGAVGAGGRSRHHCNCLIESATACPRRPSPLRRLPPQQRRRRGCWRRWCTTRTGRGGPAPRPRARK